MKKYILIALAMICIISCTDNTNARKYGGTEHISISANEEFINITWKDNNLWVITKDPATGKYYAREKSAFGLWQGKVIISKDKTIKK